MEKHAIQYDAVCTRCGSHRAKWNIIWAGGRGYIPVVICHSCGAWSKERKAM